MCQGSKALISVLHIYSRGGAGSKTAFVTRVYTEASTGSHIGQTFLLNFMNTLLLISGCHCRVAQFPDLYSAISDNVKN